MKVLFAITFGAWLLWGVLIVAGNAKHVPPRRDCLTIADELCNRCDDLKELATPDAFSGDSVEAIERGIKVERLVKRIKMLSDEYRMERARHKPPPEEDGT